MKGGIETTTGIQPATLFVFAISHYCEKARWALDYLGVPYRTVALTPGFHGWHAKRAGAPGRSVPFLVAGDGRVVQGSSAIIDWAEAESGLSTTPNVFKADVNAMETRLDQTLGVQTRRHYYSEILPTNSNSVRKLFASEASFPEKAGLWAIWPGLRRMMIKHYDLGPEQKQESVAAIETELEWLDTLLEDGRHYLQGDRLSRLDLTAASLLAPIVRPNEHPTYDRLPLTSGITHQYNMWSAHRCIGWVADLYRKHRTVKGRSVRDAA